MTGLTVGILVRGLDDADAICCLVGREPVRDRQPCVNANGIVALERSLC